MSRWLEEAEDKLIIVYLALHAVIAWVSDAQLVLGDVVGEKIVRQVYGPLGLTAAVDNWAMGQRDHLVATRPIWFKSCVWAELLFQFPLILWLLPQWIRRDNAARSASLVYGAHVATTMVPIYAELLLAPESEATPLCVAVYGIWIFFPVLILHRCLSCEELWPVTAESAARKKKR